MTFATLIVARLGSSRLPRKHLAPVLGRPVIEHLIDRVKEARQVNRIVLCTTNRAEDEELVALARRVGVDVFQGSDANVLQRMLDAARAFAIDCVVVVEADEVVCDWALIDALVTRARETGADYLTVSGVPAGSYLHAIRTSALARVCERLDAETSTDGWARYFTTPGGIAFTVDELRVDNPELDLPAARLTLDWPEDLQLIRAVFGRLEHLRRPPALKEILNLLRAEPSLLEINRHLIETYAARVVDFAPVPSRLGQERS